MNNYTYSKFNQLKKWARPDFLTNARSINAQALIFELAILAGFSADKIQQKTGFLRV